MKLKALATTLLATLGIMQATAGTFTHLKTEGEVEIWAFTGEIKSGDAKAYANILARQNYILLVIDSPGGSAMEGLELGRLTMKYRDEVTLVAEKAYSAAGMWWLGDDDGRFLDDESEVGWHLSYVYSKSMDESLAQVVGYQTGKYLSDVLDEKAADALMEDLATIQKEYGKFAMRTLRKDGKLRVKK